MYYVVIDLEMNPLAKTFKEEKKTCRSEIIQIGAILLNEAFQEIGNFMTLVRPRFNDKVEGMIQNLTGITTEMVQSAPAFEEAMNMFFSWCRSIPGEVQICQWSSSDYFQVYSEMLLKQYTVNADNQPFFDNWCDFQDEYKLVMGLERRVSLKQAIDYAGIEIEGRLHDALDDARNTANLVRIVRTPELCKVVLEKVIEALTPKPLASSLGDLFDFSQFQLSA